MQLTPPPSALAFTFIRASGPGGQNVNKVASAVQLRCDLKGWPDLPARVGDRLRRLAGRRLTDDDEILITAQRFRTQEQNKRDALERLQALIEEARHEPKPRKPTKPSRAAKQRRVEAKHKRGEAKQRRAKVRNWD